MEGTGENGRHLHPNHQPADQYRIDDVHCLRRRLEFRGTHLGLVGVGCADGSVGHAYRLPHAGTPIGGRQRRGSC